MKKLITLIRKQKGAVLVYLAIGIVPLVAALGLVIDYGSAVSCSNKMQRAVDAAALAGASYFSESNAQEIAEELAETNYAEYDNYEVTVTGNQINVIMERAVPTKFMRIFGHNTMDVAVSAAAVGSLPVSKVKDNIMPFCLVNPGTNGDPQDDLTPDKYGREYIIFYGEDNIIIQDWAKGYGDVPFNGNWEGLKDDPGYKNNSMGWRGALDLDEDGTLDGSGANSFRTNFANGWPGSADIGDVIPAEMGNMSGPTSQGREDRLLGEEDELFGNFNPRTDYDMGRVVVVPIVSLLIDGSEDERLTWDMYNNGDAWEHKSVIIDGFAPFWIQTEDEQGNVDGDNNKNNDGDWVVGYYIPGTRITGGTSGGSGMGGTTPPRLID